MNKIKTESPPLKKARLDIMTIKLADLIEPFDEELTPKDVWLLSEPWELDTVTDIALEHEILNSFNLHCETENE